MLSGRNPRKTIARESGEAREALIREALTLFTTKGYAATSVREIVEAAGVTKPVLYYYFGNKEGLYLELIRHPLDAFVQAVIQATAGKDSARAKIGQLFETVLLLFMEHLDEARLMYSIYYGPPQGAPHVDFEAHHSRLGELISELVREGIRRKEFHFDDPEAASWLLLGALNFAMEEQLCQRKPAVNLDGLKRILEMTLGSPAPASKKRKR